MKHPKNSRDAASLAPPPQQQNPPSALRTPGANSLSRAPTITPRRSSTQTTTRTIAISNRHKLQLEMPCNSMKTNDGGQFESTLNFAFGAPAAYQLFGHSHDLLQLLFLHRHSSSPPE